MRFILARASLIRHRNRTLLAMFGVAVATAMLLDMVMLSTGMRESFRRLLTSRGFELRISPKGTLPFDTDATIADASLIIRILRSNPTIDLISPVLGGAIHVPRTDGAGAVTAFALGLIPSQQGDYTLTAGRDAVTPGSMVANDDFLRATGARIGDTLDVASGYDPQLRTYAGRRRLFISGTARFLYLSSGQLATALSLSTLQQMQGPAFADRVSLFMLRLRPGVQEDSVRVWIERNIPRVTVISTQTALAQVDQRLSYFRQLAFILGAVSLVVGFLLVATLMTVSVNERVGEIGVMRALGVSRSHVVQQIMIEGVVITVIGAAAGLALGLVTARYLNGILSDFPGLPMAIDFFLFQPRSAWTALGLLTASGILAGIYPALRAASLPIATTLRQEAVA
ncbi:MAG: FtsX-like permease family protein [Gemmatimonadaceae bacterium]